ncbi:hypothetical protein BH24GEM2_BH24GEM2_09230 [soil metagenome]|jgi:hypothetical protein
MCNDHVHRAVPAEGDRADWLNSGAQLGGIERTKPGHPAAHRLVADPNTTLGEQFFYVPETRGNRR